MTFVLIRLRFDVVGYEVEAARFNGAAAGEIDHRSRVATGVGYEPGLRQIQPRHNAVACAFCVGDHPNVVDGVAAAIRVEEHVAQPGDVGQHSTRHSMLVDALEFRECRLLAG